MYTEVQHSFTVFIVGALFGAPFTAVKRHHRVQAHHGRTPTKPNSPIFGMETIARAGGYTAAARAEAPPLEMAYALRKAAAANKGDEWLYELSNSTTSKVNEVNGLLSAYLASVHAIEGSADITHGFIPPPGAANGAEDDNGHNTVTLMRADKSSSPHGEQNGQSGEMEAVIAARLKAEALMRLRQGLLKTKATAEAAIAATGINTAGEDPIFWEALKYAMALSGVADGDAAFPLPPDHSGAYHHNPNGCYEESSGLAGTDSSALSSALHVDSRRLSVSGGAAAASSIPMSTHNALAHVEALAGHLRAAPPGFFTMA